MRKTNRRRTNNRRRKTGKKQKMIRGGNDENDRKNFIAWMNMKKIPASFEAFKERQIDNDVVNGKKKLLYNNIYWNNMDGMVDRSSNGYDKSKNLIDTELPHFNDSTVTEYELSDIYKCMLDKHGFEWRNNVNTKYILNTI